VDREAIQRSDFPIGRRGYDQAAVDAHLRRVADELDTLRARPGLAAGASDQVRTILEAAEASAAELRADAGRRAGEHVARVEEAAAGMLARVNELERELSSLLQALRDGGERLTEGLARLRQQVGEVRAHETVPVPPQEEDFAGAAPAAVDEVAAGPDEAPAAVDAAPAAVNGDEAGARLIALNMALDGKPREETARYLADHFTLPDPDALLDDVYARAGR
jgi:DivIVA domain-containing protein